MNKECNEHFAKFSELTKHRREHHRKRPSEGVFTCEICQARIKTKSALNAHMRQVHSEQHEWFQCGDCFNQYKTKSSLKEHWLAVHGQRIIKCDLCHATFGTAATLRRHQRNRVCLKKIEVKTEVFHEEFDVTKEMSENEMADILQGYQEFVIESRTP